MLEDAARLDGRPAAWLDRRLIAGYRLAFAALVVAAIVVQMLDAAARGVLNPFNFFSYFTIQSNLIGVAAFVAAAVAWRPTRSRALDLVRGAAVVYLTVTFVVFAILLSGTDVDTAIPWVDTVVHRVFPVVVIADWLLDPPAVRITFRQSLVWLVYPLAWVGYTLLRGVVVDWYPYPFLNPANGGYGTVAVYVVAILLFGIVLCWAVSAVGSAMRSHRRGISATGELPAR